MPGASANRLDELRGHVCHRAYDGGGEGNGVAVGRVVGVRDGDHGHLGSRGGTKTVARVLYGHATLRPGPEAPSGLEVNVRRRLPPFDLLG